MRVARHLSARGAYGAITVVTASPTRFRDVLLAALGGGLLVTCQGTGLVLRAQRSVLTRDKDDRIVTPGTSRATAKLRGLTGITATSRVARGVPGGTAWSVVGGAGRVGQRREIDFSAITARQLDDDRRRQARSDASTQGASLQGSACSTALGGASVPRCSACASLTAKPVGYALK